MSIDNIIKNLDYTKIKAPSGRTYAQELVNAANVLRNCIQSRIKQKTMQNSLTTADIADIVVDGNSMTVDIKVQNSIRPSIFKKWNKKDANVFWLLNDGFTVKKDWYFDWAGASKEKFVVRTAERWVEEGIKDFNAKNNLNVRIKVVRPLYYYGKS